MGGGFELHHSAGTKNQPAGLRDVAKEHENVACKVTKGEIPEWIGGALYRQSGGAFLQPEQQSKNGDNSWEEDAEFLDGLAHITCFRFENGKVLFSNKFMRTKDYTEFIKSGKRTWAGTAAAPKSTKGLIERTTDAIKNLFQSDIGPKPIYKSFNPNVTISMLSKPSNNLKNIRLAATTEAEGTVCEFDPTTLSTIAAPQTMPLAKGQIITNAAHWFFDNDQDGGYHCALELDWKMKLTGPKFTFKYSIWHGTEPPYKRVAEKELCTFGWGDRSKQVIENRASYMHTISQTKNFVVLINGCWKMQYEKLLANDMSKGFFGFFEAVDTPVEFLVFKIKDSKTHELDYFKTIKCDKTAAFMVWHLANSFEDHDGNIIIDGSCGKMPDSKSRLGSVDHGIVRFKIDLENESVQHHYLAEATQGVEYEFPNINPQFHMQEYSGTIFCLTNPMKESSNVAKLENGKVSLLEEIGPNTIPTEPVFVSKPGAKDEQDGILLVEAIDGITGNSELLLVNPVEFKVIASVQAPIGSNFGLHSIYVSPNANLISKY